MDYFPHRRTTVQSGLSDIFLHIFYISSHCAAAARRQRVWLLANIEGEHPKCFLKHLLK